MINRWVVPDIHGCLKTLKTLLETRIELTRLDSIYFLGDYIDRGPDSKGVIDYIINLQNNNYRIHGLKGNHEYISVKSWKADRRRTIFGSIMHSIGSYKSTSPIEKNWRVNGGNATLESFGAERPCDIEDRYIDWKNNTKYYIELEDYVLVHAGLNFNVKNPFKDTSSMISVRDFNVDRSYIGDKRIICGHTPTNISCIMQCVQSDVYDALFLDNGVHMKNKEGYGNLLAYNLDTKELIIQPNID